MAHTIGLDAVVDHFTLDAEQREALRNKTGATRLGFALVWRFLLWRGRFPRAGLSPSTIGRIWRRFDLKPHRADTFKISTDPQFVDKIVDVVRLYHHPPEQAVVLCVDEKSQVQALDRSQPVLPLMPGMPERRTHDGTATAARPHLGVAG